MNLFSATEQPDPVKNNQPAVWQVVILDVTRTFPDGPVKTALLKDMNDRDEWGRSKYGVPLQPFNGRDALVDLYQEFLDATVYTKQFQLENPGDHSMDEAFAILLDLLDEVRGKLLGRG